MLIFVIEPVNNDNQFVRHHKKEIFRPANFVHCWKILDMDELQQAAAARSTR